MDRTLRIAAVAAAARTADLFDALVRYGLRPDMVWYGADMCPSVTGFTSDYGTAAFRIGSTAMALRLLRTLVLPLEFGVFVGLPAWIGAEAIPDDVSADGPARRRVPGSELEVAVFDDRVIEITTDDPDLLEALRTRFAGTIIAA
jgi:hypothetical protein